MNTQVVQEIKDELKTNDYNDFLNYLGIDPEDFEEFIGDFEFDDYSS